MEIIALHYCDFFKGIGPLTLEQEHSILERHFGTLGVHGSVYMAGTSFEVSGVWYSVEGLPTG